MSSFVSENTFISKSIMIGNIVVNYNDINENWGIIISEEDNSYRLDNGRLVYKKNENKTWCSFSPEDYSKIFDDRRTEQEKNRGCRRRNCKIKCFRNDIMTSY